MNTAITYRQLFADMVGRLGDDIDLARGALYIAGEDCQDVDVEGSIQTLDDLALRASEGLDPSMDLPTKLERLSLFLGPKEGFRGDKTDYYNPQNAYLNRVLERKKGIPITLSLIYMEVGLRLGIVCEAIGLPGHLVIRAGDPSMGLYMDPFHRGRLLSKDDCLELMGRIYGGRVELRDEFFRPYTKKQFLVRILANLKNMHVRLRDYTKALAAVDRMALIDPNMGSNLKERAWIFSQTGQYRKAIKDLEAFLKLQPRPDEAKRVKGQIQSLWKTIATLN